MKTNITEMSNRARLVIQWASDSVSGEMITTQSYQRAFIELGNCNLRELNFLCDLVNRFYIHCHEKRRVVHQSPNKLILVD